MCESGGWGNGTGGKYVGDLGITTTNWADYDHWNSTMPYGDLSPINQAAVGAAIAAHYVYAGYVPDQNGACAGW